MARHMATSSLAAQANGGERPLESTAVMDAPLVSKVSTTSIIPRGAAKCKGLWGLKVKVEKIISRYVICMCNSYVWPFLFWSEIQEDLDAVVALSIKLAMFSWPLRQAICRAVSPWLSATSMSQDFSRRHSTD